MLKINTSDTSQDKTMKFFFYKFKTVSLIV